MLSLTACAKPYTAIDLLPPPADVPDAALVVACDTAEGDPLTNLAVANELINTRKQRDDCAARVAAIARWRADALTRAAKPATVIK